MANETSEIRFRSPHPEHGRELWDLVRRAGVLEPNSPYAYLLIATHFSATSLVAEIDGRVVGFVAAYRPPTHPEAVFVWQIGVDASARGRKVASRILHALLRQPACSGVRYLEATVTPSNEPSAALFRSIARDLGVSCEEREHFPARLFPGDGHECEVLFRIGPIPRKDDSR